jgi:hypothetical protein
MGRSKFPVPAAEQGIFCFRACFGRTISEISLRKHSVEDRFPVSAEQGNSGAEQGIGLD